MITSEISNKVRFSLILLSGAILVLMGLICSSYTFDMEPPSGEAMLLDKAVKEASGQSAYDRVQEGSNDPSDIREARDYANDNMAWR